MLPLPGTYRPARASDAEPTRDQCRDAFEWLRVVAKLPGAPIEATHALFAWHAAVWQAREQEALPEVRALLARLRVTP